MTEREKMIGGRWYDTSDPWLAARRDFARDMSEKYNRTLESEWGKRREILEALLGSVGDDVEIYPNIKFDYGCNTYIGHRCYINFNATFLDCAEIRLGNDIFIGPNVSFLTPVHPLLAAERNVRTAPDGHHYMIESCRPITVEDNVWIGGGATVLPGVTIGHDSVIGAGSVVSKDIPPGVIAAGNPCRVIREITQDDAIHI